MKTKISYSLLAAASCGLAFGAETAYTTPVGYNTQVLPINQFSFLGLTMQNPTVAAGVLDAVGASSVTDAGVDFVTLLGTPSATSPIYVLELENGTIQEIATWTNAGVLNTVDNLTAQVTPGTTKFKLRRAATVSEIFGPTNSAGLTPDDDFNFQTLNDLIYIINGSSTTIVYYSPGGEESAPGWYTSTDLPAGNLPIIYADGFYVKRGAGLDTINLVTSGEVKTKPTAGVLVPGFNYVSSVAPVGLTLGNSGLQAFLSNANPETDTFLTVDNVQIPGAGGSFTTCYYLAAGGEVAEGWYTSADVEAGSLSLEGGFLIRNRSASNKPYKLNVPTNFSNL